MLLLLLCRDVSLNPGPLTLCILNARSVWNKGPLLANIVATNYLDFLYITETHVCPSVFYSLLLIVITYFLKCLVPQVLLVLFFSLDPLPNHTKQNLLFISHL